MALAHDLAFVGSAFRCLHSTGSFLTVLLSQLHSIAEGILRKDPSASFRLDGINYNWIAGGLKLPGERIQIIHVERGMCLLGGTEVFLHAEMQLLSAAPKPNASPCLQRVRLRDLDQPENSAVEGSRRRFLATRHRDLNVI